MQIISRARWGARHDLGFGPAPLPAEEVWLHHSVTIAPDLPWVDADGDGVEDDEERAMRLLEDIGEQRFGGGTSYTFAVMPSGRIYEGHGVDRQGAHTANRNSIARAIVLVGDYTNRAPTDAQVRAIAWLLQHGRAAGWWRAARLNGGHRQAPGASTACPGDAAFRAIPTINRLAAGGPIEEDDMTPAQAKQLDYTQRIAAENQERIGEVRADIAALRALVAADKDIDPAELQRMLDNAMAKNIAEQRAFLEQVVRDVVPEEQADLVVAKLAEKLSAA